MNYSSQPQGGFSYYYPQSGQRMTFDEKLGVLLRFDNLSEPTKKTLVKVYNTLALCIAAATAGSIFAMYIYQPNFWILLAGVIASSIWFTSIPINQTVNRLMALMVMCGITGISLTPLINLAIDVNPSIVVTSLMATVGLFGCFSLFALLTDKRTFMFMGGSLAAVSVSLLLLSITQFFAQSHMIDNLLTVGVFGLVVAFVVYDTQIIVYKIENGNHDYIKHSFTLFLDMVDLFRIIITFLLKKQKKNERSKNNRR